MWLLWRERHNQILVAVDDEKMGASFFLEVGDGEQALDVFHHPYAYSARRGIETSAQSARPAPAALED